MPSNPIVSTASVPSLRGIAIWLLLCVAMIYIMVLLGGLTRLTHSGLSMVEWNPISGVLPPRGEQAWQEAFAKYQQFPEFRLKNSDLDLAGFKSIYWLEFSHRLWGRCIALFFLIPGLFFLLTKRLPKSLKVKLIIMFALGGLQGLLGWFMVQSGLSDRPDVSQYRLVAHLLLAFALCGWIFWVALGLLFPKPHIFSVPMHRYKHGATALIGLLTVTIASGGFVAGTDAGFFYNTFPLMGGRLIPDGLLVLQPVVRNFFENVVTIQFTHRLLAILIFSVTLIFAFRLMRINLPERTIFALCCLSAIIILQLALGISTVLLAVPVPLALAHQAGGLLLFIVMLWLRHELRGGA